MLAALSLMSLVDGTCARAIPERSASAVVYLDIAFICFPCVDLVALFDRVMLGAIGDLKAHSVNDRNCYLAAGLCTTNSCLKSSEWALVVIGIDGRVFVIDEMGGIERRGYDAECDGRLR